MKNLINPNEIKTGDTMLFSFYVKVENVAKYGDDTVITVRDVETQKTMNIDGNKIIQDAMSADLYAQTESLSRTKIISIIKNFFKVPIQVQFVKKDGSPRNMVCRFLSTSDTGYGQVEEITKNGFQTKQVDLRTIEWIIVNNVRYLVK